MVKINLEKDKLIAALFAHNNAIVSFVKKRDFNYREKLFNNVNNVMPYSKSFAESDAACDYGWLQNFISADVKTLRSLVHKTKVTASNILGFTEFLKIYSNNFSKGSDIFVDSTTQYNAYAFAQNLGLYVCPYCDEEFLDKVDSDKKKRTFDIDHFFPKSVYPALAMCFFNLVPSGKACNHLKKDNEIGKSPFEDDIENCTWLMVDSPNITEVYNSTPDVCKIVFRPQNGMQDNVTVFALEDRYKRHTKYALQLLKRQHDYPEEKMLEMAGFEKEFDELKNMIFDLDKPLLKKLRYDLLFRK